MQLAYVRPVYAYSEIEPGAVYERDLEGVSSEHARTLELFSQASLSGDYRPLAAIETREVKKLAQLYGHLAYQRRFAGVLLAEQARRKHRGARLRNALHAVALLLLERRR